MAWRPPGRLIRTRSGRKGRAASRSTVRTLRRPRARPVGRAQRAITESVKSVLASAARNSSMLCSTLSSSFRRRPAFSGAGRAGRVIVAAGAPRRAPCAPVSRSNRGLRRRPEQGHGGDAVLRLGPARELDRGDRLEQRVERSAECAGLLSGDDGDRLGRRETCRGAARFRRRAPPLLLRSEDGRDLLPVAGITPRALDRVAPGGWRRRDRPHRVRRGMGNRRHRRRRVDESRQSGARPPTPRPARMSRVHALSKPSGNMSTCVTFFGPAA